MDRRRGAEPPDGGPSAVAAAQAGRVPSRAPAPVRLPELAGAVIVAAILTVAFTWPLAARFGSAARVDSGDGRYSIWNVAWVAHALTTSPARVFDANIFFPHQHALAFSEANLVAGALAVPAWLATANPIAASNWVVCWSFVLSAVATYLLVRRLTAHVPASAVAAVLFAFCPYVFAHLPHVQLLMTFGLPLVLLATHAFTDHPSWSRAAALGAAMALAGLACGYYGVFGGLASGVGVIWFGVAGGRARQWRYWGLALASVAIAGLLVAPFFAPYLEIRAGGFDRALDEARTFSVGWRSYLASARIVERWMLPLIGTWREVLLPGFVTLGLATVALAAAARPTAGPRLPGGRSTVWFYAVLAGLSLWASLGPDAGLYRWLYDTLPVFALLRAPARFGVLVTLALAVLAGIGVAWLARAPDGSVRWRTVAAVGIAALASSTVGALPLFDAPPVNVVYRRLAGLPRAPLAEFPYFAGRADLSRHTRYMLMSTYHWQPLVNGYSDYIPADVREDMPKLATFPGPAAWTVLRARHVRYVVVHWNIYPDEAARLRQGVEAESGVPSHGGVNAADDAVRGRGLAARIGDAEARRGRLSGRLAQVVDEFLADEGEERPHGGRIELRAGPGRDLGRDVVEWQAVPVRSVRPQGVVDVRNGEHPGRDRDLLTREALWIALPVPALMVLPDDGQQATEGRHRLQDVDALRGVLAEEGELFGRERPGLVQDLGGYGQLADVVHETAALQGDDVVLRQAHRPADPDRHLGHPFRMSGRPCRLGVNRSREGRQGPLVEGLEVGELVPQFVGQRVERRAELLELVRTVQFHRDAEVTSGHAPGGVGEDDERPELAAHLGDAEPGHAEQGEQQDQQEVSHEPL